ncbi:MAG: NAD(P)-dependent oxidoreductase [Alphaproteobacteria bacterium]|nr:NAD(P)-dependent oxidoreductase [Alphaproteobacteria bacterium]
MKLAFIGLGVMGFPMAGHLATAGHDVTVYNRTTARARSWVEKYGGKMAKTPAQAARGMEIVFACVGNDDDVRSVATAKDGIYQGIEKGAIFVDHTTASANFARELDAAAKEKGCQFLDAPVSGGQAGAENGVLTVMVGGRKSTFRKVEPVIGAYAREAQLLGPAGAGQLTKMVNQICIAGLVQGLAEGMNFAQRAGLDGDQVLDVISKGAAQSWQMENRGRTMLRNRFNFGFAVEWMRKDLSICLEESRRNGARLPVAALVDQFYAEVQALGGSRWDTSSLMKLLTRP